jgi:nitroreductase
MEFSDVIRKRRMTRNYAPTQIPAHKVERIVDAALGAPSAGNSQGVSLVVVTEAETRRAIAGLADEQGYVARGFDPWISTAPVHIVISVSEQIYKERYREPDKLDADGEEIEWPIPYWWVDAGAALMGALLAAVDEGLAAGFLGVHAIPDLATLLGMPVEHTPIGVVTVGHPLEDRRSASLDRGKRSRDSVVHRERWRA